MAASRRATALRVDAVEKEKGVDVTEGPDGSIERVIFDAAGRDEHPLLGGNGVEGPDGTVVRDGEGQLSARRARPLEPVKNQTMVEHAIRNQMVRHAKKANRAPARAYFAACDDAKGRARCASRAVRAACSRRSAMRRPARSSAT